MSHNRPTDSAYQAFVHELAHHPGKAELLDRLRSGHRPDAYGWCDYPGHAHRWERHPCPILQLVDLVEGYGATSRS